MKSSYIADANAKMEEMDAASIQANQMLIEQNDLLDKINELQKQLIEQRNSIFEAQTNIKYHTSGMREAMTKINAIQNDTASIEKEEGVLIEVREYVQSLTQKKVDMLAQIANHEVVTGLLATLELRIISSFL